MKYRKLRIAWSVVCGIGCLLIIALWVRSYWRLDLITQVDSRSIQTTIGSQNGTVYFAHFNAYRVYKGTGNPYASHGWMYQNLNAYFLKRHFFWERGPNSLNVNVPHWLPAMIAAAVGAGGWLPLQFSLRTLLIGMTLAAIGLGWIVYAIRN